MSPHELAAKLRELAGKVRRLPPPNHRKPDAFHEARSEVAREIDVLASGLTQRPPPVPLKVIR